MSMEMMKSLLHLLTRHSRPFLVKGENVKLLYSPEAFFRTLKVSILKLNS